MGRSDIMYKCPLYLGAICKWDEPSEQIQRRESYVFFYFFNQCKPTALALCKLVIPRTGLGLAYTVMAGVSTPFACKRCQGGLHHNENTWWKMSMATDLRGGSSGISCIEGPSGQFSEQKNEIVWAMQVTTVASRIVGDLCSDSSSLRLLHPYKYISQQNVDKVG